MSDSKKAFEEHVSQFDTMGDKWQDMSIDKHFAAGFDAGREAASAVVPEDEVSLQDAANKICQHLPENMVLSLCMENGAAWVELGVDRIGNVKLPDSADKTLINQINDALFVAIGWNGDLVKQEQES
jgi:hypothetical protein